MSKALRVGIAGLGTVGIGTFKIIENNSNLLRSRCNKDVVITAIASRDKNKDRGINIQKNIKWCENTIDMANDNEVDVVIEMIGGDSGIAYDLCKSALENGKHVVTANKALIAKHGFELAKIAKSKKVELKFEAAVAGGIPIIKSLKEGLVANNISKIAGIMNGTGNYILTKMQNTGADFDATLKEAQELGYAEADPSFDVDGVDTAHKLAILSSIAFGGRVNFDDIYIEGIRKITQLDMKYAEALGYKIKLLGICKQEEGKISQYVYPALLAEDYPIAKVDGVNNAIYIDGDFVNKVVLEGPGAGEGPTASSVIADVMDIACERWSAPFGIDVDEQEQKEFLNIGHHTGEYYIRFPVNDEAGVLAAITEILSGSGISIESIIQRKLDDEKEVNIVCITHKTNEKIIVQAIEEIKKTNTILAQPQLIRIESI